MNIFNYLQKKGINTVDSSFYRKVAEWESFYVGNVKGFTNYKIYSGKNTWSKRKRKSLGMAKKVTEDIADLLLNERVEFTISNQHTSDYVHAVLEANNFLQLANEYQERKAATGTAAYIPYITNGELMDDGRILNGEIGIDYVDASDIYPVTWNNGNITECVFVFRKTYLRKPYLQFSYHHLVNGEYVIENTVVENQTGSQEGKELTEAEWQAIKSFEHLVARLQTGSAEPQFVIDKLNIVNNASSDKTNPLGVSIFANAIDILKKIDVEYDSYCNEFEMGRKRVFVAPEMTKNMDGSLVFDPDDTVFYQMPEDYAESSDGLIHEMNMELRTVDHQTAINDDLNYLSLKCGFGTNRYKFENGQAKTATEVVSENSDLFRTLKKHEITLDSALKHLIRIIIQMGISMGVPLDADVEIIIDFDDSIIEDKEAERQQDIRDISIGAMTLAEYRSKWYNEPLEEAEKHIVEQTGLIE